MATGRTSNKEGDSLEDFQEEFKKIGNRLREIRTARGFSSAEKFSIEYGFDRKTYGEWENGKPMSVQSLLRVLRAHDMTLPEFFSKGFK